MLRVASVVANFVGFRLATGNQARIQIGEQVLDWASSNGAQLVVFPAGYLRAPSPGAGVTNATTQLRAKAKALGLAVVIGVDTCGPSVGKTSLDTLIRLGRLPFFTVTWAPGMPTPTVWQQRSVSSRNWQLAGSQSWAQKRILALGAHDVAVAICGEAFSQPLRSAVKTTVPRPSLMAVPAHTAHGSRHGRALAFFGSQGIPSVRAVHALWSASNVLWTQGTTKTQHATMRVGPLRGFVAEASVFEVRHR